MQCVVQARQQQMAARQRRGARHSRRAEQGEPSPSAWAAGLNPSEQHEWLVDCYRIRVDDTMVYGGGCVGLYAEAEKGRVLVDFLVFCKLALARGVVPPAWDWPAFLHVAADLISFAFEKADAKEKWGGENVFSSMFGGR
jgi:hypothetical protein